MTRVPVPENAIAIIGIAGRFPGADDIDQFWRNIREGRTSITQFSAAELEDAFPDEVRNSADFVRSRAILKDVDQFDAELFGMRPREAALTDPQHRLLLECAWSALEDAACDSSRFTGAIGVFAGCSMNTYFLTQVCADRSSANKFASDYQVGSYDMLMGALSDTLATRLSYKLNLRGPALTVQSACSTSLLAIAQACQSLLLYQSDVALAGGVSVTFPQRRGYIHQEGGMVSADGMCRPFDADATGTVFGDGAAIVVLRRLEDAITDKNHIYAVIRGSAVNNDGGDKVGFTAPSVRGQADVIAAAHATAGIVANSIGYLECHGTATPLGDPIEFAGLVQGFGQQRVAQPYCALGSVKANVGHLDVASGVTGLIKAVLALHHREIPPLANFRNPNRYINLSGSPFYVPVELSPWREGKHPRRAGVSSFGVGGTNVHVVLEEAPPLEERRECVEGRPWHILPLSASNDEALSAMQSAMADHLSTSSERLEDIASTLQIGRRDLGWRTAIVCRDRKEAAQKLREGSANRSTAEASPRLVFLFPGQGSQYSGMARTLYRREPVFRAIIDRGSDLLRPLIEADLRALIVDGDPNDLINETQTAQPALFLVEYALARLWMHWGVKPDAMVGHSVGEFVAAAISGVLSFEDALRFVAKRGELIQSQPRGTMLAVRATEPETRALAGDYLDIAAVNAPQLCVVSGSHAAIAEFESRLASTPIKSRRLHTSHAFHSRMMDAASTLLMEEAGRFHFDEPQIPFVSCTTAQWQSADEAASPRYWARHCREAVRFKDAVVTACQNVSTIFLEVGPGSALITFAAQSVPKDQVAALVPSLNDASQAADDDFSTAEALARLWTLGVRPDWSNICSAESRRVRLPTYRFQRRRHWIEAPSVQTQTPSVASEKERPAERTTMSEAAPQARKAELCTRISTIIRDLTGDSASELPPNATFLELGFDSLFLGQVAQQMKATLGVNVTFRQLLGEFNTIDRVASHLDALLPEDALAAAKVDARQTSTAATSIGLSTLAVGQHGDVSAIIKMQLEAMQRVIDKQLLALGSTAPTTEIAAPVALPPRNLANSAPARSEISNPRFRTHFPDAGGDASLTKAQQQLILDLTARTEARMPGSKALAQQNRPVLADPRTAAGFKPEWKELVFPLVCARSKGSRIWDVDGNEYIDLVNGYGQTAFGHAPDFVCDAITEQLQKGFAIGPQTPLAGEVAQLISKITGAERVTFCNTGSEAVMAAMRVARAATGRKRIVVFAHDYHGQFDEVLIRGGGSGDTRALPIAPGIPSESVANMLVLEYGADDSLTWIRNHATELAAVIVEPVQSRRPDLQPVAFLRELRSITEAAGAALVFDEIVTGFRVHQGGAQAAFGIRADLITYGKVLGGGMPIGVLAGKATLMDVLDGGQWSFGDASAPEVAPTFFAGTFVRHPLVLAAARATLQHMLDQGPGLQENLSTKTTNLVANLNADFSRRGISTRAESFSSWFYVNFAAEDQLAGLFFPLARCLGLHIQEGYPCFLTTAHSDADIKAIEDIFGNALDTLAAAGVLAGDAPSGADRQGNRSNVPASTPSSARLTEPQLEILTAAQMSDEASCAFNESISVALDGPIEAFALFEAVNAVVARHEALRGRVGRDDECMHFTPSLLLLQQVRDLTREQDPAAALASVISEDARTPFDLWEGPLVRATLARLAHERHVFIFTAHHIVCDGWSMNIVLNDLAECYRARAEARPDALPTPMQFSHYARSDSRAAQTADLGYWSSLYADIPPLPDLPTDRPRPAHRSFAGATYTTFFDAALHASLRKAGARHGATLFATLFAGLQTVIARLSNNSDIVIAVPLAGQSLEGDSQLVGHCVQFLPFRCPFAWETPFSEHLKTIAQRLLDGFDHPHCTYGSILRALPILRSANRLPLTEVQFNLERIGDALDFGAATVRVTPNPKAAVNFDLFVNIVESEQGLRVDCDYNTDLFDETTIARWMSHYRRALEGICAEPDAPMSTLPIITSEQERFLLDEVNDTVSIYPRDKCVHTLFAERAAVQPNAVACTDAEGDITYAQLDLLSSRLAQHILRVVPTAKGRVAVATDRSRWLLISLLGVMKSGHAYVPLDVRQPIGRLQQIAAEAKVSCVICQDSQIAAIAPDTPALRLDQLDFVVEFGGPSLPKTPSDESAYILFTSGSTGTPKGVEVSHRALTNLLCSIVKMLALSSEDRVIGSTAVTFDVAATEFFSPLLVGGTLTLATTEQVQSGFGLSELAKQRKATLMQASPTGWKMLLEASFASWPGLKMITVGEPMPRDVADQLLEGGGRLWNLYGPTETTIYSSGVEMAPGGGQVTIGSPIANTQIYVLDDRDALAPLGVVGNLFIGGDGLAAGYFNRPDLTSQAFRTIALAGRDPQRLYRTGDLARLLPSGEFEILGREDQQVKLRGFRIELEEIEIALRKAPKVQACAVTVRSDVGPEPVLVGYFVASDNVGHADLAAHLASRLPAYMIPSRWVRLEALPVTPNGKLDRKALIAPTIANETKAVAADFPRTDLEAKIAAVWAGVLGAPEIGIDIPIFSLGADSLQLFRITARLAQQGIPLDVRELMKNPTVAKLAKVLQGEHSPSREAPARTGPSLGQFRHGARRNSGQP